MVPMRSCNVLLAMLAVVTMSVAGCGGSSGHGDGGLDGATTVGMGGHTGTGGATIGGTGGNIGTGGATTVGMGGRIGTGGASTVGLGTGGSGGVCNGFAPCGGTLEGTWQIDSMCLQGDINALMAAEMGMTGPACDQMIQSLTIQNPKGTVSYSGGVETSNLTMTLDMRMLITEACMSSMTGTTVTLSAAKCSAMEQSLVSNGNYSTATCTFGSASCQCHLVGEQTSTSSTPYTISGNTIVYSDGSDPASFCVNGTTLTETGTSGTVGAGLAGVATFHRGP
jgi:hypothetical protein